jgi:signal-transduction protein with cAMP-binding, CBS, and nucleotidyltransferase domain
MMERNQIKSLPVVRGNQLVGIINRANLLHALASLAQFRGHRRLQPKLTPDACFRK